MNFYKGQHKVYCGIDLHARKMYLCILDEKGDIRLHKNMNTDRAIEPLVYTKTSYNGRPYKGYEMYSIKISICPVCSSALSFTGLNPHFL